MDEAATHRLRKLLQAHVRECAPDDFHHQTLRVTRSGAADEAEISMLVEMLRDGLALGPEDVLLDLGCGNGSITDRLFSRCAGGEGVDFTEALIEVALRYFARPPSRTYLAKGAVEYVSSCERPERFTKVLFAGAFQCLSPQAAQAALEALCRRFSRVDRVLIAMLPDRDQAASSPAPKRTSAEFLDDYQSAWGLWRTRGEMTALAAATGWHAEIRDWPSAHPQAPYRFDTVLTRASAVQRFWNQLRRLSRP